MPRPRPPFLQREITRHRKTIWYFRRGKGARIRIYGDFGTPEFNANYEAAYAGQPTKKPVLESGSLEWLIGKYKESAAWEQLSQATKDQRDNIFKNIVKTSGNVSVADIDKAKIGEGRDRRRTTPNQANNFIKTMRGMFRWAVDRNLVQSDPTVGIKLVTIKTDGFRVWTDEEIAAFEDKFPIGTRERVWFDVLLYTGLRRGDAALLGPKHVRDGVFRIKTEKNGVEVTVPIIKPLAETLAVGPIGLTTFICGARGEALTKESFGNYFRRACEAAGVPGTAHGLRKAGATRIADAGASQSQLKAMFGWTDDKMASLYTRKADRAKLAADVVKSLSKVRAKPEKPE